MATSGCGTPGQAGRHSRSRAAAFPPANAVLIGRVRSRDPVRAPARDRYAPCLQRNAPDAGAPKEPLTAWLKRPIAPTDNAYIDQTYRYGSTMGGFFQQHQGVEFNNPDGTPVMAALGGTVVYAGRAEQGALTIAIRHDTTVTARGKTFRLYSIYYHNSSLAVKVGERVKTGQVIARVGNTGRATNDHLHLELRGLAHRLDRRDRGLAAAVPAVYHQSRALDRAAAEHRHRGGPGVRRRRHAGAAGADLRPRQARPDRDAVLLRRDLRRQGPLAIRSTASTSR